MQFKQIFIPTKGRNTYTGLTYNTGTTIVNNGGAGGGGTNYWALENNIRISTEYEVIGKQDISAYGDGAFAEYSLSVIDNLTSTSTTDALSANQGRVLKQLIDNYSGGTASSVSWNNVTDKPTTIAGYGITNAYTKSEVDTFLAGKSSTSHTHTFASITNKPTTLAGYGITDAYTKSQTDTLLAGKSDTGHTHTFASITDKPTTIAGYGITDAYTKSQVDTFLAGKSDTGHTHTFASITNKPTTIAGYGITDAYTSSQVNSIVSNYLPLSGGTLTGALYSNSNINASGTVTSNSIISVNDVSAYGGASSPSWSLSVIDNLTSTSTTDALSANQGRVLKDLIDNFSGGTASSVSWNNVTNKPTTIAGYGITDAYTKSEVDTFLAGKSSTSHTHTFASITNKPTTIAGYGITDAYTSSQVNSIVSNYLPLSGGTINGFFEVKNYGVTASMCSLNGSYVHMYSYNNDTGNPVPWIFNHNVYCMGDFYDYNTGNSWIHTGNIGSQSVNYANSARNASYATYLTGPYSYPNNVIDDSTTSESLNVNGLGSSAVVAFHGTDWGWSDTLYWTGYGKWGGTELATQYNAAANVRLKIRKFYQGTNTWGSWTEIITSGNIGSQSVNYAANATRLYASDAPYRYGDSNPYYAYLTYSAGDNRWYMRVYPETPAAIKVDYATNAYSASYATNANYADDAGAATHLSSPSWGGSNNIDCLRTAFANGYIPRNKGMSAYLSHGSGSMAFGWMLSGYDSTPYGGWFVSNYGVPSYVGVNNGTWSEYYLYHDGNCNNSSTPWVCSTLTAAGEVYAYSDARLKTGIKDLTNRGYLKPKTFIKNDKKQIGFIAQDVKKLYPELVEEDEKGMLILDYPQLTAVLSAQINEQHKEIDSLKDEINSLKEMVKQLINNKE